MKRTFCCWLAKLLLLCTSGHALAELFYNGKTEFPSDFPPPTPEPTLRLTISPINYLNNHKLSYYQNSLFGPFFPHIFNGYYSFLFGRSGSPLLATKILVPLLIQNSLVCMLHHTLDITMQRSRCRLLLLSFCNCPYNTNLVTGYWANYIVTCSPCRFLSKQRREFEKTPRIYQNDIDLVKYPVLVKSTLICWKFSVVLGKSRVCGNRCNRTWFCCQGSCPKSVQSTSSDRTSPRGLLVLHLDEKHLSW